MPAQTADGGSVDVVSDELRTMRVRKVYIEMRLPAVRDEIKKYSEEHKLLGKDADPSLTQEAKKAWAAKKIYANQYLRWLREELKSLETEKTLSRINWRPRDRRSRR